jgi:hypothetical protein
VLICEGGLLLGESAVDPVVSVVSQGWVERIVERNDCRLRHDLKGPHVANPLAPGEFGSPGPLELSQPIQVPAGTMSAGQSVHRRN